MDIVAVEPDAVTILRGGSTWRIYLSGEIDGSAAAKLEQVLREKSIPGGSDVYIHSGGGSAVAGMELGRVIRNYELTTHVGKMGERTQFLQETDEGYCMSSAALAFLGGVWRYVNGASKYGVHRFVGTNSEEEAQRLAADIVGYIREMGVNTELFTYSAETPADDILELPEETLRRLNVANYGYEPVVWTVESIEHGIYLKGYRETVLGVHKFMLTFNPGEPVGLYAVFQGGNNTDTIMMMPTDRLEIDGECISLSGLKVDRWNVDGWINGMYVLTDAIAEKLKTARSVGYILQFGDEAPVFCGYNGFSFDGGREKLGGLLKMHAAASQQTT